MKKQKPKILIIEDDEFMVKILTRELNQAGLSDFSIVNEGKSFIKEFKRYKPTAVVLDILLPDKNGLEALKDVRKLKNGKHIPVFVLTNYSNPGYRKMAKFLGVNDYMIKSNTLVSELIKKIKALE